MWLRTQDVDFEKCISSGVNGKMIVGTDTFGNVKKIRGTPIVTTFTVLQMLPLYPLKSYYFLAHGKTTFDGIPLIAEQQNKQFFGIPLASVDRASVVMTYLRGIFAAAALCGCLILMFAFVGYLSKEIMNERQKSIYQICLIMFVVGVVGGVSTYAVPLIGSRERKIREHCFGLLGIAIDPACVESETCQMFIDIAESSSTELTGPHNDLLRQLVIARVKIAQGINRKENESATDSILEKIERSGKIAV